MTEVSTRNFGYLIAYVIPGFVVVGAISSYSVTIRAWLSIAPATTPTVGGFLYVTLASVAAGMTVSALRWLTLDYLHHRTGVARPNWDFSALQANRSAFDYLNEAHYRYYQFYGNMFVALLISLGGGRTLFALMPGGTRTSIIVAMFALALFFVASRDALRKYYARTKALLSDEEHGSRM